MRMTLQEQIQQLRKASLFQKLKPEELKVISLCMEDLIYEAGEVILSEGNEGAEAYVIYSGQVEVYRTTADGKEVRLNRLGPGELFGDLALFGDGFRSASVKAIGEVFAGVITRERLYDIICEFPDIAIEMLKVQTQRFSRAENRLMEFLKKEK